LSFYFEKIKNSPISYAFMRSRKKEVSYNILSRKEKIMLHMLLRNGRAFNTRIANKINVSSQLTGRIRKELEKEGIIKGYSIELNHKFLGIKTFVIVLFDIKGKSIDEIMTDNLINLYKVVANTITHIGIYAFKELEDFDKYFISLIKNTEHIKITNTFILPVEGIVKHCSKNLFYNAVRDFDKKGICNDIRYSNKSKKKIKPLSNSEKSVLKQLVRKSNISCKKISLNLNKKISRCGVNRARIKLEKFGIIRKYNVELDYEKLGIGVLAFIFVNPKSEILKNHEHYIRQCQRSRNIISCYRLNEATAMFCGFRNLNDLESYINILRSEYKDLIEIKDIHIISPKGVIKESFDDLYLKLLS